MVFKITDFCGMGCNFCMQKSTPKGAHASDETLDRMLNFIEHLDYLGPISISGGEPTEHPKFFDFLNRLLKSKKSTNIVTVLTNGEWLNNPSIRGKFVSLLKKNKLMIQITSIRGIYPKYEEIKSAYYKHKKVLTNRTAFVSKLENGYVPVGRAVNNVEAIEKVTFIEDRKSTSCFNMYSSLKGNFGNLVDAIHTLKTQSQTSYCKPVIDQDGNLKFGEYANCSSILNINELPVDVNWKSIGLEIFNIDGPCGSCVHKKEQVQLIKEHLSIYKNVLCDFKEEQIR